MRVSDCDVLAEDRAYLLADVVSRSFLLPAFLFLTTTGCGAETGLSLATSDAGCTPVGDSGACIELTVSPGDLTCTGDDDCAYAAETGRVCITYCSCPGEGVPVNRAAAARFEASLECAMLPFGPCSAGCPEPEQRLACVAGTCTTVSIDGGP